MSNKSETYADNFEQLNQINKKIQDSQNNPNIIDELEPLLEKASKSYQICKARIESVEKFIDDFCKSESEKK